MAKRNVTVTMKADYEYEAVNPQGNKVLIDMYDPEKKQHQSPMDLVLSAVASCASVDAVLMMKKKRKTVENFKVETEGDRNDGVPAFYKTIHMNFVLTSPDATEEEFAKVVKLAVDKYCSVSASLSAEISYSSEVKRP
ncbi:OsmC family protein [Echinicola marina]|uniref:OsmC family protein n=1 Tax=Echinicola marina TaxID=2859768 RepID=UPI001CF6F898|nr:OsmC family protein [Echinicola marina]UCS91531.1 OsmC family protein [Echinicola marina]